MGLGMVMATVAAFNLVCIGDQTYGKPLDLSAAKSRVQIVVRIDPEKQRWCSGDCEKTSPIQEMTETAIVFESEKTKDSDSIFLVNRESGEFINRTRLFLIDSIVMTRGTCTKAAFTGFPVRKF